MATADPIVAQEGDTTQPRRPPYVLIPPEEAAAQTLRAHLGKATFYMWSGEPDIGDISRGREFQLAEVLDDWPEASRPLQYPSAAVTGAGPVEHLSGFTPSPLECSWDEAAGEVLWQVGWVRGELQIDFWADSRALRNAIAAQFHGLMNPRESMTGLLLAAPDTFACLPIRYLVLTAGAVDVPDAVYANERRYMATVEYEAPLIDRRGAREFAPKVPIEVC